MDRSEQLRGNAREIFQTIQMLKERMVRCFEGMPRSSLAHNRAAEVTFPQWNAMTVLQELGEVTLKELAERLQVSPPSASVMVDRLVDLQLVIREQRTRDRRTVGVCLSPAGVDVLNAMEAEMLGNIEELMAKLGPEKTAQWCSVYASIRAVIEAERNEAASSGSETSAL